MKNLFFICSLILLIPVAALAQSTAFTFQGRLNDGTAGAAGNVQLEVRLYDSLAGGGQIGSTVNIPNVALVNGVFSTELDFGGTAFDGSPRFLEISVRPAGSSNPYTVLGPRQHLSSVPYSIKSGTSTSADSLSALCSGCVQDANITNISGSKVTGEIPPESVPTGSGNYIQNADPSGIEGKNAVQQAAGFNISGTGVIGRLGIGIAPRGTAKLDVLGTAVVQPNAVGSMVFGNPNSETGMTTFVGDSRADLRFDGSSVKLVAGLGRAFDPPSTNGIVINTSGNVGIGTATPNIGIKLQVNGNTLLTPGGSGGDIQFGTPNGETGMSISGLLGRADIRYDETTLKLVVGGGGSGPPSSANGIAINKQGKVGVGTDTPQAKFHVNGSSWFQGDSTPLPAAAGKGIVVGFSGEIGYITSFDYGTFTPKNLILNLSGANVGIGTATPQAKLDVAGTTKTNILQITGGSDLAEHFEFGESVKPGMVVAIDPLKTGKLIVARGVYNRRVAGIVSGANSLSAGMTLPDLKDAKNSLPVALSGRVWVYCDATRNAIQPGDLLTTSPTPGHAMRVASYTRAQGAIIGKAMSRLKSGKGLVLVLVTLQ
ncbi:MAG: hypothetical protein ABJB34_03570 [Acidobacteriota bacterium]